MKKLPFSRIVIFVMLLVFLSLVVWVILPEDKIDYNSQVKPILNKHCISCHGGVKQSGGFSLLFENEAKGKTNSGTPAIIPGHPNKSEFIKRVQSKDPEERMPYEKEPLSKDEIQILKSWIKQGAVWDTHWSYEPVKQIDIPELEGGNSNNQTAFNNSIDHFVYGKLQALELESSKQADVATLARRLSLDIIGLPMQHNMDQIPRVGATQEDLGEYIDQLLNSPHFGEKWASMWMDLARYSDTKGYERDDSRTIWKYRDWLIKAFNEDKPYDQFLVEQIAGDMLPNPSEDQFIATAFHRNTMTNDEGGTDNEEFRVAAVFDRVNTTWEVTMGTTFACVQCHGHPYDPFKHEDYYKFMAFFNNSRDEDTYDDYPVFRHFENGDSLKLAELKSWLNENAEATKKVEIVRFVETWQPSINSLTSDHFINSELADTKWLVFRNNGSSRLRNVELDGKNRLIYRHRNFQPGGVWEVHLDSLNGPLLKRIHLNEKKGSWTFDQFQFDEVSGTHDLYFTYANPNLKNPFSNGLMFDWFYFTNDFPGAGKKGYEHARDAYWDLISKSTLSTPVMVENPDDMTRETQVFERGNWLSKGEAVTSAVPEIMNEIPEGFGKDRLGMAKWLTSTQNPLTARTYVNRIWEQLFGYGIVETLEDFGTQGIPPTHQELLDHLAWKFMHDFQWSTKALLKYIVSSATYQQSSVSNQKQLQIDPQNRYFARGPRIRLSAEQIRDQALVVSGLFNPKMFGPSVMPYQPGGIWNSPYNGRKWIQSEGREQYRRAIYTYWKRTSPYPSMLIFDAMAREVCASRRISTNTPLQALVTLNDSAYVEASIHFAKKMIDIEGDLELQIRSGYKSMMSSEISDEKLQVLVDLYNEVNRTELIKNVSDKNRISEKEKHEQAMVLVANTMLNLDEFLMKN